MQVHHEKYAARNAMLFFIRYFEEIGGCQRVE